MLRWILGEGNSSGERSFERLSSSIRNETSLGVFHVVKTCAIQDSSVWIHLYGCVLGSMGWSSVEYF